MDDQLTDELVENMDTFSSPVCLGKDCYDVSPLSANYTLPATSTKRRDDEHRTDEPAEDTY